MSNKTTILVVDDDAVIIKLLESILAKDYKVVSASDGHDIIAKLKEHKPQMIVLDIMMPGVNGYDICRDLKFNSPYQDIPILFLTSRDQEIDPRIGKMMGVSYLQKPVDRGLLLRTIKQILN